MKTQRVSLFSRRPCCRCGQPVGSRHVVVAGVPGRRFFFCGLRCVAAWSAGVVARHPAEPMERAGELWKQAVDRAVAGDKLAGDEWFTSG